MSDTDHCSCFRVNTEALQDLADSLIKDGFMSPPQIVLDNQTFGLAKNLDDVWQLHVRGDKDGTIRAEVEVSWIYLEHAWAPSYSAHPWIRERLIKYSIPFRERSEAPNPCLNPRLELPDSLTEWKELDGKKLASYIVQDANGSKLSVAELKDILQAIAGTMNKFSGSALDRILAFESPSENQFRIKIDCPIFKTCGEEWCQKACLPMVDTVLNVMSEKITFKRQSPIETPHKCCQFDFFLHT